MGEKTKRIILICPQPFLVNRGTPLAILNIVRAISELGYYIDLVITHLGEDEVIKDVDLHRIIRIPFLKEIHPGLSIAKFIIMPSLFLKAFFLMVKNKYEFIVCLEDGAIYARILKILFRKKYIYRMHSLPSESSKNKGMINKLLKVYEKIVFSEADVLLPVLPIEVEAIKSKVKNKKIIVMEILPALKKESVNKKRVTELKNRFKLSKDDIVVLWIGGLAHYQGAELLFQTIKEMSRIKSAGNIKFLVTSDKKQIEQFIKPENYENLIIYNPDFYDMPNIVAMGDICLSLRYLDHGFPSKVKVFLRAGKPIIAVDTKVHRCHLFDKKNSYLIEYDKNELIKAIEYLAKNEATRFRIGKNAKEYYDKNFSWKKYKDAWNEAIQFVVNQKK